MSTVKQLLDQKGHDVETIHPDDTVYNAIKRMAELNIGSLMVVEDGKPVGIISERHYARNVYLKGKASPETHVRDIMEADFAYVRLHGPDGPYRGTYDGRTLSGWARRFKSWSEDGIDVYCYFDNDEKGYAALDARRLLEMIGDTLSG